MKTASKRIRSLREVLKMTRPQFAELLGVPLRTIESWEYGVRTPPEYVVRMIEQSVKNSKK